MATLKRVEIHGGFLDDLDLELSPGLNVLIGPRGSGKTSLLEILRFAFGVGAITPDADARAREHALDVLSEGAVTVTVATDDEDLVLTRHADSPDSAGVGVNGRLPQPLIVSQSEIEEIGLNARSRLQILDGLTDSSVEPGSERALLTLIGETTTKIGLHVEELDRLQTRALELQSVLDQLRSAEDEAEQQAATSAQMAAAQSKLRDHSRKADELQRREAQAHEAAERAEAYDASLGAARAAGRALFQLDLPDGVARRIRKSLEHIDSAEEEATASRLALEEIKRSVAEEALAVRRSLREHGATFEALQEGAGEFAKRLTRLRELGAERTRVDEQIETLRHQLTGAQETRSGYLDELDDLREQRFRQRQAAATYVAELFDGEIEIRLTKGGLYRDYEVALASALEGSNLQYKSLARQLVARISPRELVEAVERGDSDTIAAIGEITPDRAQRLVAYLRAHGTTSILTVPVEDMVDFALLDGTVHKTTAQLSTGQRCTVVLPLLLAQRAQLTILDQPEDHLDNAFIVETLIRAVINRKKDSQLLIATHNANIPVLGEADRVISMSSDGRHGGIDRCGELEAPEIVEAVTAVMEGGEEAFRRRADFYGRHH